jgi:hypothetical protein
MASKVAKLATIVENPGWNKKQKKIFGILEAALPTVMSYASGEIPVLDNHSDAQIVDELGPVKALKKAVEAAEKPHGERLKARMNGKKELVGEEYQAEIRTSTRTAINQGEVKAFIDKCDNLQIDIMKLLGAIANKQVTIPNEVFLEVPSEEVLAAGAVEEDDGTVMESNGKYFYSSTSVEALYVKEF